MADITSTTELVDIYVNERINGIPSECVAEVWFHDEKFYVNFNGKSLIYSGCFGIESTVIDSKGNELHSSFTDWIKNNREVFWTEIWNHSAFDKFRDQ